MNLLIVDDEIYAIQGILDDVNWEELHFKEVLSANSFEQAVKVFEKYNVDILLCDIEMPFGSGIDLVEWVKEHHADTECIFLTCHDEFSFAREAIKLKCMDYILKPAPTGVLMEVLAKAIHTVEEKRLDFTYQNYGKKYVDNLTVSKDNEAVQTKSAVDKAEAYIREHSSEPITVEELAKQVFLSPDHLTRSFKKVYNITIIDYITEQRMFLAKEMLKKNELSISMISAKVGYGNYSHFTKMFKKYYGKSPREYQQEYLKGRRDTK